MLEQNLHALIPYAVNFSVVIALLVYLTRKPTKKFVYQRHERMRDAVESAAAVYKKAASRSAEARALVSNLAKKEAEIMALEKQQADIEKKEILDKSKHEALRLAAEADRLVSVEQDESSEKVKELFLDLVVRGTEDSLRRGLKKDDHSAILKRAQNSIEVGV